MGEPSANIVYESKFVHSENTGQFSPVDSRKARDDRAYHRPFLGLARSWLAQLARTPQLGAQTVYRSYYASSDQRLAAARPLASLSQHACFTRRARSQLRSMRRSARRTTPARCSACSCCSTCYAPRRRDCSMALTAAKIPLRSAPDRPMRRCCLLLLAARPRPLGVCERPHLRLKSLCVDPKKPPPLFCEAPASPFQVFKSRTPLPITVDLAMATARGVAPE